MATPGELRSVGESAWSWVLAQLREQDGVWLPEWVRGGEAPAPDLDRDSLYCGVAGLGPVLREIEATRGLTADEAGLSAAIVARLELVSSTTTDASLYFGLSGHATALQMLGAAADASLTRLLDLVDERGWPTPDDDQPYINDVISGTAGIVMAGTWFATDVGDEVARVGADRLIAEARVVGDGLSWTMTDSYPAVMPNFSHGTAGIAAALAVAGERLARDDLVDAATRGARHLLSLADLDDDGFRLPLVIPAQEDREPFAYGWCHGPLATGRLFTALARVDVTAIDGMGTEELQRRCVTSVLRSGVPARRHPGFWDNDARCCGTTGVGDMLLDLAQGLDDPAYAAELLAAAAVMGEAILDRAITDDDGTRWQFLEHRNENPLLDPNTSWMQGAAGMAAFLLRLARVLETGLDVRVIDRPDQFWSVPDNLRASR
jgi:hypothetical protein